MAGVAEPLLPSPGKAKGKAAPQERGGGPAPISRHRRVFSDEGGKLSPFLPPEIFQKLQIAEAQAARKCVGMGTWWAGSRGCGVSVRPAPLLGPLRGSPEPAAVPGSCAGSPRRPYSPGSPQGADAAGGGVAAEPEAEGCLRGAGGAAEPQPGRAENLAGKRGARGGGCGQLGAVGPAPGAFVGCHRRSIALQTLSLQRQMMENLVIAKAREETVSLPLGESSEQGPGL